MKKIIEYTSVVLAIVAVIILFLFYNREQGNPVSKRMMRQDTIAYLYKNGVKKGDIKNISTVYYRYGSKFFSKTISEIIFNDEPFIKYRFIKDKMKNVIQPLCTVEPLRGYFTQRKKEKLKHIASQCVLQINE